MGDYVHGDQHGQRSSGPYEKDVEAGSTEKHPGSEAVVTNDVETAEVIRARDLQNQKGILRTLRNGEDWLDRKMGIETQGVDRIHEEDKRPPSILNVFLIWFSVTLHVGTLPIGILGPTIFYLSLGESVAMIIVGTMLGAACVGYCGTLGPKLGLRAIATSRYSFGFYGAKLCSVLNVVVGGGFAVVNTVVVGQILSAVSDYKMTIAVGCVIIAIISYIVSIFGFAIIHTYEKYSWIMSFILLSVLIGQVSPAIDASIPSEHGLAWSGSMLSMLALCFSSASGWCSIASDYYCNYPANTKSWKIFMLTFWGVSIPTIFVTIIGACLGNAAFTNADANPILATAYTDHGLGGLLRESYHPLGWSKFALVLFVFSVIGNNVAVNYSSGLSLQLLGHYFHAIPRFIWSFLNALVIALLAIAGQTHLSNIVSDFVSLLGYWTVSFTFILLVEDQFFRKRAPTIGYDLNAWDMPGRLPWGAAAVFALLVGYCCGGVVGMSQTWYVGPLAAKFSEYGGDVGIYLSGLFTLLVYPPARWYERKMTGR